MKYLLVTVLLITVHLHAQQPPSQLPSLLDGTTIQMPVLQENEDANEFIHKNIFVKAWASKTTAYIGEPILVTYKLFTSLNSQARVSKQPAFNGCSVMELSANNESHEATIKGKLFHVFVIRKIQVIPLQEGTLQLGPASVDNVVQLSHAEDNSVENFSVAIENNPLNIEVKPLPAAGKPSDFNGLVGNYSIEASITNDKVPAGEDASLRIVISGTGNIAGVPVPAIRWPLGTEHFDGSDTQHIDQDNFPVTGYKIFVIPFIGNKEGNTIIEPISFSFFDPILRAYKTVATTSLPVVFTKPVSRDEEMKDIVIEDVSNKRYLWIVGAIAATVIITWLISSHFRPQKKPVVPISPKQLNEIAPEQKAAEKKKADASQVFAELNELSTVNGPNQFLSSTRFFLLRTLQSKFEATSVSEYELILLMKQTDAYTEIAIICENIFDTCNRNLYSPLIEEDICEKIYFELTSVIKRMYELG